jgi:RHS repeat-associated protein
LLTDELGDVAWEASYKAWGEAKEVIARASSATGTAPQNPIRFQGQQADGETGLVYNRHRYYDTDSGRFVSKDPIGLAGGLNLYQYAPNAIGWVDPLGWAGVNILALPAPTNAEPWMPNTPLMSAPAPTGGLTVQMAMAPGQTRPGGWATTDNITSVDYVRNDLAVTPQFKPDVSHVQTFHIPEGVQLQHGTVGPQEYGCALYPGGGSQVQILNYSDRAKLVPIGAPRPIE